MVKNVVYKPVSLDPVTNINAPKEIDKPDYPDKGIAYAGYSKTNLGNSQYRLNPQNTFRSTGTKMFIGGELTSDVSFNNEKTIYIKKITFSYHRAAAHAFGSPWIILEVLENGSAGEDILVLLEPQPAGRHYFDYDFEIPIKIPINGGIRFYFSLARAASEYLYFNFYGWEE
jgi:hypothetical protein